MKTSFVVKSFQFLWSKRWNISKSMLNNLLLCVFKMVNICHLKWHSKWSSKHLFHCRNCSLFGQNGVWESRMCATPFTINPAPDEEAVKWRRGKLESKGQAKRGERRVYYNAKLEDCSSVLKLFKHITSRMSGLTVGSCQLPSSCPTVLDSVGCSTCIHMIKSAIFFTPVLDSSRWYCATLVWNVWPGISFFWW